MADKESKAELNVGGKYYNDNTCIDCDLCRDIAPQVFTRNDDEAYSYVWKQPQSEEDLKLAQDAMNSCPTESIGDNG